MWADSPMNDTRPVRIVVAEDEPVIRLDLVEQLRELGYEVVGECGDGASAVELCRTLNPDVVLLDINMPGSDGLSAARAIAPGGTTAVIMLTAYGQRDLVDQAVQAGAMAYLTKPWSTADLMPAIETARSRSAELRQLTTQVDELEDTLRKRKLIDRAKARLITAYGITEPEAFRMLQRRAMDERTSMAAVAERILDTPESGPQV